MADNKSKKLQLDDASVLSKYRDRFQLAWSARSEFETEWKLCDDQFNANTFVDNDGNVQVNIPLEKTLIENWLWRVAWKLNYEVIPDWEADVQELMSAKYTLEHFLDDSTQLYNFYQEKRKMELDCQKYGTMVSYNGLTMNKELLYELTDEATNFYDETYNEITKTNWCFIPRNLSLRNFWVDYSALRQSDFRKAKRCIMQETDTPDNLKLQWKWIPWFRNLDKIQPYMNLFPAYLKTNIRPDEAMVHYYYDKITKDYRIIVNRNVVVYTGKQLYAHWQLPFTMRQFFPNTACLYGEGQARRNRSMKWYKNTTMQTMIKRMEMSSGINLALFGDTATNGDLYTAYDEMNIWKFTWWQDSVKQLQLDGNIQSQANLLTILDDQIIQDSGENLKAPYSSPANTATEIEVIEENKATRNKTTDELRDEAWQDILTQVLKNIAQFAPALLKKEEYTMRHWKKIVTKVEYPVIKVPNTTIRKKIKKWESMFIEDWGKYGFFELKPKTIWWNLTVKIATPNTKSNLKVLERNSITQYITNMQTLSMLWPDMAAEVSKRMKDWWIFDWMNLTYGYDMKLTATTKKDDIKQKQLAMIEQIKQENDLWPEWLPWMSPQPWWDATPPISWMTPTTPLLPTPIPNEKPIGQASTTDGQWWDASWTSWAINPTTTTSK